MWQYSQGETLKSNIKGFEELLINKKWHWCVQNQRI